MTNRAHIHNTDCAWMAWLRACSKLKIESEYTLYDEYTRRNASWHLTVHRLCTTTYADWPFCRGNNSMSSVDIASARNRYLDMYPLTKEQLDSAVYVDSLLRIDQAQIELRCKGNSTGACPGCAQRDRTLSFMRTALSAAGIGDEPAELSTAAVTALFRRYFIVDPMSYTPRKEIRRTIEAALQREIGATESLPATSKVWKTFVRCTLNANGSDAKVVRCRLRAHPLSPTDLEVEGR